MNKDSANKQKSIFDNLYKSLNVNQKKAVDSIEGPVIVIAGPGTGKTTVLTLRIANILLRTDIEPESILALTFTESGAYNMRKKLFSIIGNRAYKVNIHTFHGFASKIIDAHYDYFPRIIGSTLVNEPSQIRIIEKIINREEISLLRPYGKTDYYILPCLSVIHSLKRENISPEKLRKSIDIEESLLQESLSDKTQKIKEADIEKRQKKIAKNRELAFVYEMYEKTLSKENLYDFDDMLIELIKAMEHNPEFKLILQENYQYILADEHQDANLSQNRILELLSDFHDSPNLFIVGDDKQSIYRFQGASLENFIYFSKKYKDAVIIDLDNNYRSHQKILDASHTLISNNPTFENRNRVNLVSHNNNIKNSHIGVYEFDNVDAEIYWIKDQLHLLINKGVELNEIAVIYRDNSHGYRLAKLLKRAGISYNIESESDILSEAEVIKLFTLLRIIDNPADDSLFADALFFEEFECNPVDVVSLFKESYKSRESLYKLIKNNKYYKQERLVYEKVLSWAKYAKTRPFIELVDLIIKESRMIESIISSNESARRLNILKEIHEYLSKLANTKKLFLLSDFIDYLNVINSHGLKGLKINNIAENGVRLMTAHKSKGLEFEHVFIVHTNDGIWGNKRNRDKFDIDLLYTLADNSKIEDERRLFYVAMTRAKSHIYITYSNNDGDKSLLPSQFISEINDKLKVFDRPEIKVIDEFANMFQTEYTNKILNKDFISELILNQGLSVTHLNNYRRCPWTYFFVNLIRIPQAQSKSQIYGTIIHEALRIFFDAYKKDEDIKLAKLLSMVDARIKMMPLSQIEKKETRTKAHKTLKDYYETYYPIWNRRILNEYSIKVEDAEITKSINKFVKCEHFVLNGNLDKIEFINDGEVGVVDYKTGKPKTRNEIEGKTKNSEGDYKRQLVFYKLLIDTDNKWSMKYGEIDFIEANDKGQHKKERFEIEQTEIVELKADIVTMIKEVVNLDFIGKNCDEKDCHYCALGRLIF
jgi:DNA helicase-2/ATP-dependent DNA helicase PcrA